ncbi:spore coat protein CotJA [Bacillus canaveralius]|uniref:Spore coat protein CotJA n=1 Tax=Bacillus canaveralius TaxID=1403243 RepID=A0A2N5GMB7_9BACI|nr:spore coat associated protein CotJA [Bacillus canaveralius]PLR82971.1 spore coat protein CotJA [Bacillus canaveralius]PLR97025.1 spore coat protein CotJA [Bacillus canaveralius]RSK47899.1 spore coat associated protein CotJA [Bacillus canaveralius]
MTDQQKQTFSRLKAYRPFHSVYDPCRPIGVKFYSTPPQLYLGFQPANLQQFSAHEALKKGTLWPVFWDYYNNPYETKGRERE